MVNLHRLKVSRPTKAFSKQTNSIPISHFKSTRLSYLPPLSLVSHIATSKMSWMDSWSRPSKHHSVPVPFYLLPGGGKTPYCHSCGRAINLRRKAQPSAKDDADSKTPVKYCSASCRGRKPGKVDREIEDVLRFLQGEEKPSLDEGCKRAQKSKKGSGGKRTKGDQRLLISCEDVERFVFGPIGSGDDTTGSGSEDNHEGKGDGEGAVTEGTTSGVISSQPQEMVYNCGTLIDPMGRCCHVGSGWNADTAASVHVASQRQCRRREGPRGKDRRNR